MTLLLPSSGQKNKPRRKIIQIDKGEVKGVAIIRVQVGENGK
jgi:hypothetical protein